MAQKTPSPGLKPGPSRQMLRRTLFLMAVFGIGAFLLLLARLYKLQILDHEKYESMAIQQQLRSVPSSTVRGTIYDTGWGFPAYTREGETKIVGELLVVDDEGFRSMDRLEGHPRLYRREEIEVFTEAGPVRAWVYIMNALPGSAKVIKSGSWRKRNG